MSKRTVFALLGVCVLLVLILAWIKSEGGSQAKSRQLLGDMDAGAIRKVLIEQGGDKTTIALEQNSWKLSEKNGYPADSGKVRSLLLRMLDLNVTQEVTAAESKYDALGVSESSAPQKGGVVRLFGAEDNELGGLMIGDTRKRPASAPAYSAAGGQYVRKIGDSKVYLTGETISVLGSVKNWLNSSVVNVLSDHTRTIEVKTKDGDNWKAEYSLIREPGADKPKFVLASPESEPKPELNDSELNLVKGGLENVSLTDVYKADDENASKAAFDYQTTYTTVDGTKYTVDSAAKPNSQDAVLIKIAAVFDSEAAKQAEAEARAKFEAEQKKTEEEKAKKAEAEGEKKDKAEKDNDVVAEQPKFEFKASNNADAAALNAKFSPWIFEIPLFQGKKFRVSYAQLTSKPAPQAASSPTKMPGPPNEEGEAMTPLDDPQAEDLGNE